MSEKYMITREQLIELRNLPLYDVSGFGINLNSQEKVVDEFLKSKQPIEQIASGNIVLDEYGQSYQIGDTWDFEIRDKLKDSEGENIKIFIQKVSEK